MQIRRASAADVETGAQAIYSTMDPFGDAALGLGSRDLAQKALAGLFCKRGNRFSHDCAWIAEADGQAVGALLAFPGMEYRRRNAALGGQIWSVYGLRDSLRLIFSSTNLINMKETERDEYYTAHVAVLAPFRGKGYGAALLNHVEQLAAQAGLRKCSLVVDLENEAARRLYLRLGYRVVERVAAPEWAHAYHFTGHERMVKVLQ